jgi:hypothetical protein
MTPHYVLKKLSFLLHASATFEHGREYRIGELLVHYYLLTCFVFVVVLKDPFRLATLIRSMEMAIYNNAEHIHSEACLRAHYVGSLRIWCQQHLDKRISFDAFKGGPVLCKDLVGAIEVICREIDKGPSWLKRYFAGEMTHHYGLKDFEHDIAVMAGSFKGSAVADCVFDLYVRAMDDAELQAYFRGCLELFLLGLSG